MEQTDTLFVLRRAFLFGVCRRADVNRAFGTQTSPNRASSILRMAVAQWPALLYAVANRGVFPRDGVPTPIEAKAGRILELLAQGAPSRETGVFPGDGTPILMPKPKPARALHEGATQIVLDAALHHQPVRILYVGMRRGESARWRRIWPRALEFTGLHWRIHAQEVDAAEQGFPIKVFVLARVMDARTMSDRDIPTGFKAKVLVSQDISLRVSMSPELTPDQVEVIKNDLDIRDGVMTWPAHALHEFKREFTRMPMNPDIVWPVLSHVDPLE